MADTKISALTAVVTPAGSDELAVNQSGTSKKITLDQIRNAVLSPTQLILPSSGSPAPTVEGDVIWDSSNSILFIGDGSGTQNFYPADFTSPATQAFGDAASPGDNSKVSRLNHKHGMPADPTYSGIVAGNELLLLADITVRGSVDEGITFGDSQDRALTGSYSVENLWVPLGAYRLQYQELIVDGLGGAVLDGELVLFDFGPRELVVA
jgi:hypothetical protein